MTKTKLNQHNGLMTPIERKRLLRSILAYLLWLRGKVQVAEPHDFKIVFPPPVNEDWLMRVQRPGVVEFNSYMLTQCNFDFYELVVLHEAFHLFVQGLLNKEDVKQLKDDFGDMMMKLLDIEAD